MKDESGNDINHRDNRGSNPWHQKGDSQVENKVRRLFASGENHIEVIFSMQAECVIPTVGLIDFIESISIARKAEELLSSHMALSEFECDGILYHFARNIPNKSWVLSIMRVGSTYVHVRLRFEDSVVDEILQSAEV